MSAPSLLSAVPRSTSSLWIQWTLSRRGRPTIISFCGDLGAGNADDLVERLQTVIDECPGRLVFDLAGVTLLDRDGQEGVGRACRHAAELDVRLDVVCPPALAGDAPLDTGKAGLHASLVEALEAFEAHPE